MGSGWMRSATCTRLHTLRTNPTATSRLPRCVTFTYMSKFENNTENSNHNRTMVEFVWSKSSLAWSTPYETRSRSSCNLDSRSPHILLKSNSNGQTMSFHHSNTAMKVEILLDLDLKFCKSRHCEPDFTL